MIDADIGMDDIGFVALILSPTTIIGLLLFILVVGGLCYVVYQNQIECSHMECNIGQPEFLDGKCFCTSGEAH